MRNSKPILLVEDDRTDTMIVKRALEELKVTNKLIQTADGSQALDYLQNTDNKRPCLILLDLNMPKTNGIEFLNIVKADDVLKKIPIIVLTISTQVQDVVNAFKLGVAGYIIKPVDYIKFVEAIRTVTLYWTLSELPRC